MFLKPIINVSQNKYMQCVFPHLFDSATILHNYVHLHASRG